MLATTHSSRAELRENIEYGQAGDLSLRMDAHIPEGDGPFAAVIIVHGGGWIAGDRKINVQPLFEPLSNAGFAWFSISYRLAKDFTQFGTAVQDIEQALEHVRTHAADYKIDEQRIALVGESAGAHLAAMAALEGASADSIKAVVAFYGPSDLAALARTSDKIPQGIRDAVRGTPYEDILLAGLKRLSPINHVRAGMPPFLLIHGTADTLVPFAQSEALCERIHEVGGACELYAVKGAGHGMRWWPSTEWKRRMVAWLERQLNTADLKAPRSPQSFVPRRSA
jgi:acetyl esterase/lipase